MSITPMMQQYLEIKEANKECILFFRLGDFYEMFFEDAILVSRELDLTLTGKDCGLKERAPMCGVPYHAADAYIGRLIEKGYKVAVCEQMEDPALTKGLVKREITRIITPGTLIEPTMLDERAPNYLLAIAFKKDKAGIAFADVSTGEFNVYDFSGVSRYLADELNRIDPREILTNDPNRLNSVALVKSTPLSEAGPEAFEKTAAEQGLAGHFHTSCAELGFSGHPLALLAAGALLTYLKKTQRNALEHIAKLTWFESRQFLTLDRLAMQDLELTESRATRSRRGSLLAEMDKTVTAMGSRQIRAWIERPLYNRERIEQRLDAVELFIRNGFAAASLREILEGVYDIERLLSRISCESVNARDCLALGRSLRAVPQIQEILRKLEHPAAGNLSGMLDPMPDLEQLLSAAIDEEAPVSVKEGRIFRSGYDKNLDRLRKAATEGKTWIASMEAEEREKTGIRNLKIGFNRVFGYYIEVTKTNYNLVPNRYVRKQTLANCERFFTEELKQIEKTVLGADDEAIRLEYELFSEIRERLKAALQTLQTTAQGLKTLDALLSLARVAQENEYVRPRINAEGRLQISDGRHPVVETAIGRERFVPNDTTLDPQNRIMIITGPNMAGKSTYLRQVALIVIMAHAGSFVPASEAEIPLTDRVFTRIGAADDLYGGQSTFMVEMNEVANILRYATADSLLILDEVGRGTSTFDGLSIAWALVEHLAGKIRAKTLFATHYHELSQLEGTLDGVRDYRVTAREQGEDVIFLRKIVPGSADRSFGVAVASLAGLPNSLIARARQIMARLEVEGEISGGIGRQILDKHKNAGDRQIGMLDYLPMELIEELRQIDVTAMTPMDALNELYHICEKARRI